MHTDSRRRGNVITGLNLLQIASVAWQGIMPADHYHTGKDCTSSKLNVASLWIKRQMQSGQCEKARLSERAFANKTCRIKGSGSFYQNHPPRPCKLSGFHSAEIHSARKRCAVEFHCILPCGSELVIHKPCNLASGYAAVYQFHCISTVNRMRRYVFKDSIA